MDPQDVATYKSALGRVQVLRIHIHHVLDKHQRNSHFLGRKPEVLSWRSNSRRQCNIPVLAFGIFGVWWWKHMVWWNVQGSSYHGRRRHFLQKYCIMMLIDEPCSCLILDTHQKCAFKLHDSIGICFPNLSFVTVYHHWLSLGVWSTSMTLVRSSRHS